MAVLCSQCQTQNPDTDLRCSKCGTKLSRVKVGTRFIDRFQTQQILKEYDLSISYLVLDEKKHEARVLRELFPSNPSSRSLLLKFDQAARTLTNLAPPQLVPVFEHFSKDHRFYTVEKYPTGISTRDKAATDKPLPEERARSIFAQLLQAIKQLHNLNPSLYHGHLDAGQVVVSDDWQLMFLTDPGYLLDSVQEGETPSVPALLAKDLRDTALLVLELVSGIPAEKLQANKGLISETVKGLENLCLSSALEWILAGKGEKPVSLEGVELLGDIINEAEAPQGPCDEDARRGLLDQAYNLCGASRIRAALDKPKAKKQAETRKQSPPETVTEAPLKPSQLPPQGAVEDKKTRAKGVSLAGGIPRLEISKTEFEFCNLRLGASVASSFTLSNVGGGILAGDITSSRGWLKVLQDRIDETLHRQDVSFVVDTTDLPLGLRESGTIEIRSNGGNQHLRIDISIEVPDEAISRYRNLLWLAGSLCGGAFGFLVYAIIPSLASKNAIAVVAGYFGFVGTIVVAWRVGRRFGEKGPWATGCAGFLALILVYSVLPVLSLHAHSALSWALTSGAFLYLLARPLFVAKHSGNIVAKKVVGASGAALAIGIILGGHFLTQYLPPQAIGIHQPETAPGASLPVIMDEFNGSTTGDAYGIKYVKALDGEGALFSRKAESRVQYPFSKDFPKNGTLEWWIRVDSGYKYSNYKLHEHLNEALIFTTDIAGGDVTWPGSAWLWVKSNGDVTFSLATEKYQSPPKEVLKAQRTAFRFGAWHSIGISFGSQGQHIMTDGNLVASNPQNTQSLGSGGNQSRPIDVPTIGESVSGFWNNNQHEGGFEGVVDRFRASPKQKDWLLSTKPPGQSSH